MKKFLNEEPARILTSREISKIFGALIGGFIQWPVPKTDIRNALLFWLEHLDDMDRVADSEEYKKLESVVRNRLGESK